MELDLGSVGFQLEWNLDQSVSDSTDISGIRASPIVQYLDCPSFAILGTGVYIYSIPSPTHLSSISKPRSRSHPRCAACGLYTPLTLSSAPLCPPKRPSTPPGLGQSLYGAFFVMWPFNRIIVRRTQYLSRCLEARLPSGDLTTADEVPLESIPVPTQGKGMTGIHSPEPVYGEEIEYAETWQKGSYLSALLFSLAQVVFFGVFFGSRVVSLRSRAASVSLHRQGGRAHERTTRLADICQPVGFGSRLSAA
jgi:hypothetical protein